MPDSRSGIAREAVGEDQAVQVFDRDSAERDAGQA
jgi:hypothetical protein